VKVGIQVEGQEGLTWEQWERIASSVEAAGLDSLFRSDHFMSDMGPSDRPSLEAWTSLSALALMTDRITFGPLVSPVSFRHPAILARSSAAVDIMSGGRLVLGIGAGWDEREHQAFGIDLPPLATRLGLLEEAIQVIKLLWTGGPVSFSGRYFQLREATAFPTPLQDLGPPILVGGDGERRLLRIVAKYADEWNSTVATPEEYRHKAEVLAEHCRSVGRDPTTITRSWMGAVCIGQSPSDVDKRAAWLGEHLPGGFIGADLRPIPVQEAIARGLWLAGTPDQVAARLREWEAAGVQRVMLQLFDLDDEEALHLIADVARAVA
jgi:F420-dependent oxidoreductase-like protein